jgi:hypothetical protein
LWDFYIEETKKVQEGRANYYDLVTQAYKFALEHIKMHFKSGQLWLSYILFIQDQKHASESIKVMTLRSAFRQAISEPCSCSELIWKNYTEWEKSINSETMITKELEKDAQSVLSASLQLQLLYRGLFGPPVLPNSRIREKVFKVF